MFEKCRVQALCYTVDSFELSVCNGVHFRDDTVMDASANGFTVEQIYRGRRTRQQQPPKFMLVFRKCERMQGSRLSPAIPARPFFFLLLSLACWGQTTVHVERVTFLTPTKSVLRPRKSVPRLLFYLFFPFDEAKISTPASLISSGLVVTLEFFE